MNQRLAVMRLILAFLVIVHVHTTAYAAKYNLAAGEMNASLFQSSWILNGKVIDEKNEPIEGVSVSLKGSSRGTATDNDGRFVLEINNASDSIILTSVGYITKTVVAGTAREMTITLLPDADQQQLGEIVVTAFGGQQRKTDMVGSVTSIKPDDLRIPSSNLTTALAGQAAGIIAFQRSGEPGMDNADFFIRGVTSFGTGKVNPLILIDGIELGVTELARLRPDDIESFNIFKDATSTALYGARGANGVIYVVTKKGKEGKPVISLRSEGSISTATRDIEFADPVSYMKLYNDAVYARSPLEPAFYSSEKIQMTEEGKFPIIYPAVDWRDAIFKDYTFNHRHNLNVSGGGKVATYYIAGSLAQDNGMLQVNKVNNFNNNINLKSYTLRTNVNFLLTNTTELMVRLNGIFDNYNGPVIGGSESYAQIVRSSPVDFVPAYPVDSAHAYVRHIMFGGLLQPESGVSNINPYAEILKGYRQYDRSVMMAQMELKQDLRFITPGLKFRTMFNTNRTSRYDMVRQYQPFRYYLESFDRVTGDYMINVANPTTGQEYLDFSSGGNRIQSSIFYLEALLEYNRVIKEKHNLSGMLISILRGNTDGQYTTLLLSLPHRNLGVSGRGTYSYDQRYYAEFNFGYNGSERFHKDNRYGFFPSFGLAWSVSNEKFWESLKNTINNFRIRYTYGFVGNDEIGSSGERFFYLSDVNMSNSDRAFSFGKESNVRKSGISVRNYENPGVTWETSEKNNLAFELSLFRKVNITADFFTEKRSSILMSRADVPITMGLTAPVKANIGEATGKGFEVSADASHSFNKNMWLQLRGNFTYATNGYSIYEEPLYDNEWWLTRVGYSLSQPRGYIAERLFVDDNEVQNSPRQFGSINVAGDIKYKDINKDGIISTLDMVPIGLPTIPEIIYGFGFSYGYKGFDLSAFFQGSAQSSFWIDYSAIQPFVGGKQVLKVIADDHYSLDNPNLYAFYPRLSNINQTNNMRPSTWWLRDGSFLRLKQAELGWALPTRLAGRMRMNSLRVYLSASNLFLFSKFKLWDVEMGGDGLGYPLQKVFNLGVNLKL